jgi:hypothetical protein
MCRVIRRPSRAIGFFARVSPNCSQRPMPLEAITLYACPCSEWRYRNRASISVSLALA